MGFITNLIATALVYLLIPTIIYLYSINTENQYKLSTIKKIVIINGICGWLLWRIVELEMVGEVSSGAAVLLWSWIAYKMLKKCELQEDTHEETEPNNSCDCGDSTDIGKDNVGTRCSLSLEDETPTKYGDFNISGDDVRLDNDQDEKTPFTEIENTEATPKAIDKGKKGKHKAIIAILSILLVISIVVNICQYQEDEKELSFAEWRAERDKERLEFYDKHIVFVKSDGTDLYHKYDCYKFDVYGSRAYNVEAVENSGYEPCPYCC